MRTKSLLLSAAALAAGLLTVQAQQNVYSVNIVGYVNTPIVGTNTSGARQYTLVANPLVGPTNTIGGLFAALPGTISQSASVLKWDANTSTFITANKISATGWSPANVQNTPVVPGEGVFVRTSATSGGYTNTFVGEVITGTVTNTILVGYNLVGNQIPIAGDATALGLTAAIPVNPLATANQLLKFNPVTQGYVTHNRVSSGSGWSPSVPVLSVGEAFWIRNRGATSFDWVQTFDPNDE